MAYQQPKPNPEGEARADEARARRSHALGISAQPVVTTENCESAQFEGTWPTNFSKGLPHDVFGIVEPDAFRRFFSAINAPDRSFDVPLGPVDAPVDTHRPPHVPAGYDPGASVRTFLTREAQDPGEVRRWESPVAGHVYDLEGPDAGSVGMSPAPRLGSDELAAEMAEDYAMALLRDEPFARFDDADPRLAAWASALGAMPWFDPEGDPRDTGGSQISEQAARRRAARRRPGAPLSPGTMFRGSSPGCFDGPYLSQFLLQGTAARIPDPTGAMVSPKDGYIRYGAQRVDQRIEAHEQCVDYMQTWAAWLDVQNGAAVDGRDRFERKLRFITTPRDLASYVHFDALYQAYLNACLLLLAAGASGDAGLPEHGGRGRAVTRAGFATFGGPHILTLVTETATRALKAVRRQKFNYHLRARPEALGAVATLAANGHAHRLGVAEQPAIAHCEKLRQACFGDVDLMARIAAANAAADAEHERPAELPNIGAYNYLLPMAFPEGSPMHPAYGAGHATVAGACVTVLKAFFEIFDGHTSWTPLQLARIGVSSPKEPAPFARCYVPSDDGKKLVDKGPSDGLTLVGELNKLAANTAIGRNMAGVHYYTDYYDSLRMGERIAIGILHEQMITYPESVRMRMTSFDGDRITLATDGTGRNAMLTVQSDVGAPTDPSLWWRRGL
ncbi:MAG: bromoperoxidase [Pseudomonadota bacterium]